LKRITQNVKVEEREIDDEKLRKIDCEES